MAVCILCAFVCELYVVYDCFTANESLKKNIINNIFLMQVFQLKLTATILQSEASPVLIS